MFLKFINFIKDNLGYFIFLIFFYLLMTYELPYVIYTPGGSIDMSERIDGKNLYDESGSFSMTYVSMVRGSAPFLALSFVIPNWDIVKTEAITYDGDNIEETLEIDKIYMREAISNAEGIAYKHAGISYQEKAVHNIVTYVLEDAKTNLKYGDEIIKIDDSNYSTLSEFQEYVGTKNISDKIEITYVRDGKTYIDVAEVIDLEGTPKVGISIATVIDYETDFDISVKTKSSESGPSGGLMTTLAIYNQITEEDITKGLNIMGTGTIDKDGNVGEIGGVKYKILGAEKNGADVFICPKENYAEAQKVIAEKNLNIKLISAKTFDEAIEKLKKI